jgi:hypothetical protein
MVSRRGLPESSGRRIRAAAFPNFVRSGNFDRSGGSDVKNRGQDENACPLVNQFSWTSYNQ